MFVFIETVQLSVQAHQISLLRTPPQKKKEMIYKLSPKITEVNFIWWRIGEMG